MRKKGRVNFLFSILSVLTLLLLLTPIVVVYADKMRYINNGGVVLIPERGRCEGMDEIVRIPPKQVLIANGSSAVPISPGITIIWALIDFFADEKWAFYLSPLLNVTPTEPGWYRLEVHWNLYNPSTWRQHVGSKYYLNFAPVGMIKWENFNFTSSPSFYPLNRKEYKEGAIAAIIEFEVVESGYAEFWLGSHAVITDVNGDRKVDMRDVGLVARNFGKSYISADDPLYTLDMDVNFRIDMIDVSYTAMDFGFTY
jgi:hypothetical protein